MVGPTRYLLYNFTGAFCELVKLQSNDFSTLSMPLFHPTPTPTPLPVKVRIKGV